MGEVLEVNSVSVMMTLDNEKVNQIHILNRQIDTNINNIENKVECSASDGTFNQIVSKKRNVIRLIKLMTNELIIRLNNRGRKV